MNDIFSILISTNIGIIYNEVLFRVYSNNRS